MKKSFYGLLAAILSFANFNLVLAANSASSIWNYQPKEPDNIKKYKR